MVFNVFCIVLGDFNVFGIVLDDVLCMFINLGRRSCCIGVGSGFRVYFKYVLSRV